MTLAEMLRKPHRDLKGYSAKEIPWWLHLDARPKLPASPREIYNLYSWLIFDSHAADQVPAAWRDTLATAPFAKGIFVPGRDWACVVAERLGGEAARQAIRNAVIRIGDESVYVPSIQMIATLLQLDGPAALPVLAKYFTAKSLDTYSNGCTRPWLEAARTRHGVSTAVWDLLWSRKLKADQLEAFQRRGTPLTAGDLRALALHPALAEPLRGLVLAVQTAEGKVKRLFALPEEPALAEGEHYAVAHPAQVSPAQQREWRQRLKQPPFDQWRSAPATVAVGSCAADPLPLLLHLAERGWQRGPVTGDGAVACHRKLFAELNGLEAVLEHEPIPVRFGAGEWERVRLIACRFAQGGVAVENASPVAMAEVAEDLSGLARAG